MANNGYKSSRVPLKIPVVVPSKKSPNLFSIQFDDGGRVHKSLSGNYTKKKEAQRAIDYWVVGYTRDKIRPTPPANDIPQRRVKDNGEKQSLS